MKFNSNPSGVNESHENSSDKVFCVGFNKTATSTLRKCLCILGVEPFVSSKHPKTVQFNHAIFDHNNYEPMLRHAENFRGFKDRPWNIWESYKHLDQRFPGSKFILTVRAPDNWWRSVERWISISKPWMTGAYLIHLRAPNFRRESMVAGYLQHNESIRRYFSGTNRLLEINFEAGDGWQEICGFLGLPVPDLPVPHANSQSYSDHDFRRSEKKRAKILLNASKTGLGRIGLSNFQKQDCVYCQKPIDPAVFESSNKPDTKVSKLLNHAGQWYLKRFSAAGLTKNPLWHNLREKELAVVMCYINPENNQRLEEQFDGCYQALASTNARVFVVEGVPQSDGYRSLPASILAMQMQIGEIWNCNAMINLAMSRALQEKYEKIAWLYNDVEFNDPDEWVQSVAASLDRARLVQAFQTVRLRSVSDREVIKSGSVFKLKNSRKFNDQHLSNRPHKQLPVLPEEVAGIAWGAQATVLRQSLLYDRLPFQGDPRMLMNAAFPIGRAWVKENSRLTQYPKTACKACARGYPAVLYRWHYLNWAQRWAEAVDGSVDYVNLGIRCPPGTQF